MPRFDSGFCRPEARRRILAAAILGSSMGFIDGSVVAIAIPAIREGLGASLAEAQWINNAYMVAISALVLAGGAVGDRFGTAKIFATGIGIFIVTSLLCAVAPSPQALIWARWAQGAGAALMVPGSLAIIARAYPRESRGRAIGLWAGASALTTALGPVIGGIALSFGPDGIWRGVFAINLPLGLVALWLVWSNVREDKPRPDRGLDLAGAFFATTGLGLLAWGFIRLEVGHWWLWMLIGGAVALVLFLVTEARSRAPMMPLYIFREPIFAVANLTTFTLYFGLSAILFFLPMLLIAGWGLNEIEAVVAFAPLSLAIALLSGRFGKLADRIGPFPLIACGAALVALGYGWLSLSVISREFWTGVIPPLLVSALGMSMVVAPLSTAIMASAAEDAGGVASGVNNAVSRVAGLFAVAAMGPLVAGVYRREGGIFSYGEARGAGGGGAHVAAMTEAFGALAEVCAALAAASAIIAAVGMWRTRGS
ncbi:MFS transporter [Wenxinia marina]|uniref:MFS transporter n=1 Tax=Wenxinia marina TaxID=390641 RepID=UPI000360C881|nr:MFS transporter [Wenxinia marina]